MAGNSFSSQVAIVTASTSGIGAAVSRQLAEAGVSGLVINGRRPDAGRELEAELRQQWPNTKTIFVQADLDDPAQAEQLFKQAGDAFGQLDIFVHCGGAQIPPGLFADLDPKTFVPTIQGHFTSLLYCAHHAVRMMVPRRQGSIIAVASDAGKLATPSESIIGATKAAAIMFIRTLALELSRHGIRANCVTPSIIRNTKSHARLMAGEIGRRVFEKAETRARLGVPVPEDVAPLVVFLASAAASRITGQAISVNGGISAA